MYPLTMDEVLFYKLLMFHVVFGTIYGVAWAASEWVRSRRKR